MFFRKIFILSFILFGSILTQEQPSITFKGAIFGDYYYKIKGDNLGGTTQYASTKKNYQAFEVRRFNFALSNNFVENFTYNFLIEGNDGSLDSKNRVALFVKNAFVEWKNIYGKHNFAFGLVPTPTWSAGLSEKVWGYRSLEKTSSDLRGMGNPAEFGILLRGKLFDEMNTNYNLVFGNGSGLSKETNRQKKILFSINANPTPQLTTEIYTDYEGITDSSNNNLLKILASYQIGESNFGVEYFKQTKKVSSTLNVIPVSFSIFGKYKIKLEPNLTLVARYDSYNPDTEQLKFGFTETFAIVGLDYSPNKNIHYIPNLWLVNYNAKENENSERENQVVARLTFQFNF